jgi:hypothetical protein
MPEEDDQFVERVPLPEPRALTPLERAAVEFLLDGPLGRDELRAQAATARVDGVCSCGCPSVYFEVDRSLPPASFEAHDVPLGRTDVVAISAIQEKTRRWTDVTLYVCDGYLVELEIWAGEYGVKPRVDPSKLEHDDWRAREAD